MRTASISIDGEEIARAAIRDDIEPDRLAIVILKAIRDVPLPRNRRKDAGQPRGPKKPATPPPDPVLT